jgi:hydrogenase nickel incorporation protein HypA/HybF
MHEVGLISEALNQAIAAAKNAGASRIERLTFIYDPTSHVSPENVEALFMAMSDGTIAQGARLVLRPREIELHCIHCGVHYPALHRHTACPSCQRQGMPLGHVAELSLESIDIDV